MLSALLVALLAVLVPPAVDAQEAGEPPASEEEALTGFRLTGEQFEAPDMHARGGIPMVWSDGRRLYEWITHGTIQSNNGPVQLVSYDLDSGDQVAATDLEEAPHIDVPASTGRGGEYFPLGDVGDDGQLYVSRVGGDADASGASAAGQDLPTATVCDIHTSAGNPLGAEVVYSKGCFGGLYVFDGETMELTEQFDFDALSLDAESAVFPLAVDVTWTRPYEASGDPKVHVLINDRAMWVQGAEQYGFMPRARRNAYWVAQFDTGRGQLDWVTRVNACTGEHYGSHFDAPHGTVFRNRDPERPTLWVACSGAGVNVAWVAALDLDPQDPDAAPVAQRAYPGPGNYNGVLADPTSERIVVSTGGANAQEMSAWVFDGPQASFIGQIGVGAYFTQKSVKYAIDETTGRLYVAAKPSVYRDGEPVKTGDGGLAYTDLRNATVGQLVWDRSLARLSLSHVGTACGNDCDAGGYYNFNRFPLVVDPSAAERPTRVLFRPGKPSRVTGGGKAEEGPVYHVIEDTTPFRVEVEAIDRDRTVDVLEAPGATSVTFSGDARGYGFRHIEVGGLDAVHNSPADHNDQLAKPEENQLRYSNDCRAKDRELTLGLAGAPSRDERARINDLGGATALATALYADPQTRQDLNKPLTRCGGDASGPLEMSGFKTPISLDPPTWEELGDLAGIRGFDSEDEPGIDRVYRTMGHDTHPFEQVTCAAPNRPADAHGDPLFSGMTAEVACEVGHVTGLSRGRLLQVGPVAVGDAGSQYEVRRNDAGGVESAVQSWTRGITIVGENGAVYIDAVTAEAVAWATGRAQPDVEDDGRSDDPGEGSGDDAATPSCDRSRTAGTCYTRSITGVRVLMSDGQQFSCEQCQTEENQQRMVQAMQSALGNSWAVSRREPDPGLARGSHDGYEAGIAKRESQLEADAGLKGDLLPTLPALEVLRINDGQQGRGRQAYLFAGVETALTYGITCLKTITDGACADSPASLTISLTDTAGEPLPGAVFQVAPDADGDGTIGLEESLTDPHVCTTGPDGTCGFASLSAGDYVVSERLAPPGFEPAPDTPISLPPGGQGRLGVVNTRPSVTGITIGLVDASDSSTPLRGADFEVRGGAAGADTLLASCTTDADGICQFQVAAAAEGLVSVLAPGVQYDVPVLQVPPGAYVVHQAKAPDGYRPIDDIAFELSTGQLARVNVSNGVSRSAGQKGPEPAPTQTPAGSGETGSGQGSAPLDDDEPVAFDPSPIAPPPTFTVDVPRGSEPSPDVAGRDQPTTVNQFFQLPQSAAQLALRDPKQAAAFGAAWLLFGAAAASVWRRKYLLDLLGA